MAKNKEPQVSNAPKATSCKRCKKNIQPLFPLDKATKDKLIQKSSSEFAEGMYCKNCLTYVMNEAYSTVLEKRVRIEQDKRKNDLWQSRLVYLKNGKNAMQGRNWAEAVKNYGLYVAVIEKVLDIDSGQLSPDYFRTIKGEKEKGILALVYFDLIRIYDKSDTQVDKLMKYGDLMIQFSKGTKEATIVAKALNHYINFSGEAKNKKELKKILGQIDKKKVKKGCFVATYVYGDYDAYQVKILRLFRDNFLLRFKLTSIFVEYYYIYSPRFVEFAKKSKIPSKMIKNVLDQLVKLLEKTIYIWR